MALFVVVGARATLVVDHDEETAEFWRGALPETAAKVAQLARNRQVQVEVTGDGLTFAETLRGHGAKVLPVRLAAVR